MRSERLVMTRHMPVRFDEYVNADGSSTIGADLAPPFPDATIKFISHEHGWFYIYWVGNPNRQKVHVQTKMKELS